MEWKSPPTREGLLWWQSFEEQYGQWIASRSTDQSALEAAENSLRKLFERCPAYAPQIEQVALQMTVFGARFAWPPEVMMRVAQFGLQLTVICCDGSRDEAVRAGLLALCLANQQLTTQEYFAGLDLLRRAERETQRLPADEALAVFISASQQHLFGRLYELGLEENRAAQSYANAGRGTGQLLQTESAASAFADRFIDIVIGALHSFDGDMRPFALDELSNIHVAALLGQMRATREEGQNAEAQKHLFQTTCKAIEQWGLPLEADIVDLARTVANARTYLGAQDVRAFVDVLLNSAQLNRTKAVRDEAEALLQAEIARAYAMSGETAESDRWHNSAMQYARRCEAILVRTLVWGSLLIAHHRRATEHVETIMTTFLDFLVELADPKQQDLQAARLKALLDESVTVAIERLHQGWVATPSPSTRIWLAAALDFFRQPSWAAIPSRNLMEQQMSGSSSSQASVAALDRLARIDHALTGHTRALVIILQTMGERCLFLCITGVEARSIQGFSAGTEYRIARRALAQATREQLDLIGLGAGDIVSDELQESARAAFKTLPSEVQQLIRDNDQLFLVPDFRTEEDSVPFELLHDGDDYLGVSKIITRLTSICHAVNVLEGSVPRQERRPHRALVVAAPVVSGFPPLRFARAEIDAVRGLLNHPWDAPSISEERLSPSFFAERMKYISLLHIAAHGETAAGDEALILPRNQRLVTDDLLGQRFASLPFVYLNTCSLGETRYVGGGLSRGIAHALIEQGAPAVIASLTPVIDERASKLSREFYRNALELPVGEALRRTRAQFFKAGFFPVFWGTTILIGDPDHRLPQVQVSPPEPRADVAEELLEIVVSSGLGEKVHDNYVAAREAAKLELQHHPENARLIAVKYLMSSLLEIRNLDELARVPELETAAQAARELNDLPVSTLIRLQIVDQMPEAQDTTAKLAALQDLILSLEVLKKRDDRWSVVHARYLRKQWDLRMKARGQADRQVGRTPDEKSQRALDSFKDLLTAGAISEEQRHGTVELRDSEDTLEDIVWNAYVINYPNRFEDMPETAAFGKIIVQKLHLRGFLPEAGIPYASTIFSGLLRLAWDEQDLIQLRQDLTGAWVATLLQAIEDMRQEWSPPSGKPWFEIVRPFTQKVDEILASFASLSGEKVVSDVDTQVDSLEKEAKALITEVEQKYPDALGGCAAFVAGTLVEKNTFSPFEGSVHESVNKHLKSAYRSVASRMNSSSNPYLWRGFEKVRHPPAKEDELDRWMEE